FAMPDLAMPDLACPMPNTLCGFACVDTTTDTSHCGACDNGCVPGTSCASSTCGDCGAGQNFSTLRLISDSFQPDKRGYHASGVIDGKLYIWGGFPANQETWVFDPATERWRKLSPTGSLPNAGNHVATAVVNGKWYHFSGENNDTAFDLGNR